MSQDNVKRAVCAIADALTAQYVGIQAIPYDGRALPPGARLLPLAALDNDEPVNRVEHPRP